MPRYDTQRDAEMRLTNTILSYKGKALKVLAITGDLKLVSILLRNGEEITVDQDDPDLSFIPPTLGYINTPQEAVYAVRQPARRYKQGLDLRAVHLNAHRHPGRHEGRFFVDCLEGVYPKLEECWEKFKGNNPFKQEKCHSVAFSKRFAVGNGASYSLLHRGKQVGEFEDKVPVLFEKYSYLQECLDEVTYGAN